MSLALLSFSQFLHLNSEIPISAESYTFVPKNVRKFMLSTILEENLVQSNLLYNENLQCHQKEKMQLKECGKRETQAEKVKGGSGDERGQKKAKTPRKMLETRTPAGK